jgi:Arc/MetJ family transcription regulator
LRPHFCSAVWAVYTAFALARMSLLRVEGKVRCHNGSVDPPKGESCLIHTNMKYLHIEGSCVRTNIDIDDRLMRQAMRRSGARTKKAAVEAGLRLLAETHAQGSIRRLRGKVDWHGDLNQSRLARVRE